MIAGLYAITPECMDTPALECRVAAALAGGAAVVQYRSKSRKREQALAIKALCNKHSVPFIVNDDIGLALECGADGVHIGADDGPVREARERLGNGILGVSCYDSLDLAIEAEKLGADYVAFGSFYPSSTKPGAVRANRELLQMAKLSIKIPVVAIGGITPENGAGFVASGADALAVITALFDEPDIRIAAERFSKLFSKSI